MWTSLRVPSDLRLMRFCTPALILLLTSTACAPSSPPVDLAAEEAAVRERQLAMAAAEATNNADSSLSYLWEDVVMQPPGVPQLEGHAAARDLYASVRFVTLNLVEPFTVKVASAGGLAAVWGNMTYELELVGPGTMVVDTAKFVSVWEKRDSVWKVIENTWNSNLPEN